MITLNFKENEDEFPEESNKLLFQSEIKDEETYFYNLQRKNITVKIQKIPINSNVPQDPTVEKMLNPYKEKVEDFMLKPLFKLGTDLNVLYSNVRTQETEIGNFLCDLMRREYACDCAFLNSGNIRADKIYPEGYIFTIGDLYDVIAFDVPIVKIKMTGEAIYKTLENSVSKFPELEGRFLQVAGIKFDFDAGKIPGERVVLDSVFIADQKIDLEKVYTVSTADYVLFGKEGFVEVQKSKVVIDDEDGIHLKQIVIGFSSKKNF